MKEWNNFRVLAPEKYLWQFIYTELYRVAGGHFIVKAIWEQTDMVTRYFFAAESCGNRDGI